MLNQIMALAGNIAPTIATALGSPIAGAALSLLGRAFGLTGSGTTPETLLAAIENNPDAHAILGTLEQQHACWLQPLISAGRPQNVRLSLEVTWPPPCA